MTTAPRYLRHTATGVVLQALTRTPQHARDLAAQVGYSETHVRRSLWALRAAGLADVYWRRGWVRSNNYAADHDL